MKILYQISLGIMLLGTSCSEEITPTEFNYTTAFAGENSKTWKMKFVELTVNGEVASTSVDACSADDTFTFYANSEHSLEVDTGSNDCDGESGTLVNSWSYNSGAATLTMLYPPLAIDGGIPFIVREVKKNKMELELFLNQSNSIGYRIHFDATDED